MRDLLAAADSALPPTLSSRTRRGHSLPNVNVNVNVNDLPLPNVNGNVHVHVPALPLKSPSPPPALIILLCFLLGISAALGIAQQLGAFNSPSPKAGPP